MNPDIPGTPAPGEVIPPTADPVVTPPAPTEAGTVEENDAKEWEDAENEIFPGLTKVNGDKDDPSSTTTTTTEAPSSTTETTTEAPSSTTTTTTVDPSETAEQKAEREQREADAATTTTAADGEDESDEPALTAYEQRQQQREWKQQVEAVAKDVREKMYKDAPTVLKDSDGDELRTVEDVMKLRNPRTNEGFTEEEAGMFLLSAQQRLNQDIAARDKEINRISEVLVDLKDQSDAITQRYGAILDADKDLRQEIWDDYDATLIKDPATGIITGMPVSLERFYDRALRPYVEAAKAAGAGEPAKTADELKAEADAKVAADKAAADAKRADRSDIFAGGTNKDNMTDEDKEWAEAEKVVYGNQLSGGK